MKYSFTLLLSFLSILAYAQDYYWVGGGGNWSDFENHWATTSGGTTFHTSAPTSTNDVYFDANSFLSGSQVVILDIYDVNCLSMDWTGVLNFPTIDGNGNPLNIYGSLVLSPDMTSDLRFVEFESTGSGNTITSNGTSLGNDALLRLRGIGGEWTLLDNLSASTVDVIAGTFNTNGHTVNAEDFFSTSGSLTKTINLGSSQINSEGFWATGTNQTINAGTSKIVCSSFYSASEGDGPFTYYDVEFSGFDNGTIRYNAIFHTITVASGVELKLRSGDVFTVENIISEGTKHNPIIIKSTTSGSEATLNKATGTITIAYADLIDVYATGGAVFTANESTGNGNNTGWVINPPTSVDFFWVGDGGDWSDYSNHWATTSGGVTMHTDYPSRFDDVFFDANSFSMSEQTVECDIEDGVYFHHMDWTGVTNSPTLHSGYGFPLHAYGSLTFSDGMHKSINNIDFYGNDEGLVFSAEGSGSNSNLRFFGEGTYDLLSDIDCSSVSQYSGTINYNDITMDCNSFNIGGLYQQVTATVNLESMTLICDNFYIDDDPVHTINKGTSTLTIGGDFDAAGFEFYEVIFDGTGDVTGSNTFEFVTVQPGASVSLEAGVTQTIIQNLTLQGTKANPITLGSTSVASQGTISIASGTVDATYLIMQDINASGGATFNATQTIDNGNNTGWNITGIVGENYYWVGDGGNWSDFENHWATESGGELFHTEVPGVLDNVFFDENSFSSDAETVTIDNAQVSVHDLDASAIVQSFNLVGFGKEMNIYGSVHLPSTVNLTVEIFNFLSNESESLDFNDGPGTYSDFNFTTSGIWSLNSGFTVGEVTFEQGTINTNDHDLDIGAMYFGETGSKTFNLGASSIITNAFRVYNFTTNLTINGGSSEISAQHTFILESNYNDITLNNVTFLTGTSTISTYDVFEVNRLTLQEGVSISGGTITTSELVAVGTEDDPISITETVFIQTSGTVDAYYLELESTTAQGGATFNAYNSVDNGGVIGWTFFRNSQTITFDEIDDVEIGAESFELIANASSGLDVSFSIVSGPATLDGNMLTITGVGTVQVLARQSGNIDYDPAPSVQREFEVTKISQTITFNSIDDVAFGIAPFELTATASSGLDVSLSIVSGPATLEGNLITITGAGTVQVLAEQTGDTDYAVASSVQHQFEVTKLPQIIVFEEMPSKTYGDINFNLTVTGGATENDVVLVSSDESVASVNGTEVTIFGAGSTIITANQEGDENHEAASSVERTLIVSQADLTITADNYTIMRGDDLPIFTMKVDGFVYDDTEEDITLPSITADAADSEIAGEFDITLSGGEAENYNLILVKGTLTIEAILDISPADFSEYSIYPNPAANTFHIESNGEKISALRIYNLNGQIVKSFEEDSNQYDIHDLKAGIYILSFQSDNVAHKYQLFKN